MMNWNDVGLGGLAMALGWVAVALLLLGLIVLAGNLMVPRDRSAPSGPDLNERSPAAEAALELRYARGEIDAATLVEARSVLRQR